MKKHIASATFAILLATTGMTYARVSAPAGALGSLNDPLSFEGGASEEPASWYAGTDNEADTMAAKKKKKKKAKKKPKAKAS